MTIEERAFNLNGEEVDTRTLKIGNSSEFDYRSGFDIAFVTDRGIHSYSMGGGYRRRIHVLDPHKENGDDRILVLPDAIELTGNEINMFSPPLEGTVYEADRPHVAFVRIFSTQNKQPTS